MSPKQDEMQRQASPSPAGKIKENLPDTTAPRARIALQPHSDMIAPSVKLCLQVFLSLSCLVVLYNSFLSLLDETTAARYATFLPGWSPSKNHWVDTWTAAPQSVDYRDVTWPPFRDTETPFENTTIRQTLQLTTGAKLIRLRLSNKFGSTDLSISNITIALPQAENGNQLGSKIIDLATLQTVTFSGSKWVTIPDGALALSDPISFDPPVEAGQVISVSIYLRDGQETEYITAHIGSRATTWMGFGDYTRSTEVPLRIGHHAPHWYFISAVEAWKEVDYKAFIVVGDSITNGRRGRMNVNNKWTHLLFERMQEASPALSRISVVNQAAGGDQMLQDGRGPNGAARIDRDVLAQSGVQYAMIFEGINDIGHAAPTRSELSNVEERLIQYYKQIILRIRAHGIPVFGSTLTPFMCHNRGLMNRYARDPIREQTRLNVNHWIRNSGWFDAVVDFDYVLRDTSNNTQMAPEYDSGDCLHPNDDGLRALAANFPLELFEQFEERRGRFP